MTVRAILEAKGRDVITISPNETLAGAARQLAERRIGALVVTTGDRHIVGILSERDLVRVVGLYGVKALEKPVSCAMTMNVKTCTEHDTVNELLQIMTRGRFRHVPVERSGALVGIVSIGDVVKRRINAVEREAEQIKQYIAMA